MIFTDQLKNTIALKSYPKRIISLVPSQSELLWDLGLRDELIGITKFCIHPTELFKTVTLIGGTKTLNLDKIRALKPDLIIGNKEENEQSQIEILQKEFPVWMSDIFTLDDSLDMIAKIGELVNKETESKALANNIHQSFTAIQKTHQSVLYFIWYKPFMAAGNNTFIGDVLTRCGYANCLTDNSLRYPELSIDDIKHLNPELIFLSSEPFPFIEKHITELQNELPSTKIKLVDGELFSWYGSRLLHSVRYFNELKASLLK